MTSPRWLAGATFTLYLTHAPLILAIRAIVPLPFGSWSYWIIMTTVPLLLVLLLAGCTERRKGVWQRLFVRLFPVRGASAARL